MLSEQELQSGSPGISSAPGRLKALKGFSLLDYWVF